MFNTIRNAWRIPDLRKKLLYTLLIVIVFRFGSVIPAPFLDATALSALMDSAGSNSALGYINMLTGGAFSYASLFAMGITPYINSSIIMQLLTIAIPPLERLAKEGEEGRKKIATITRYVTVVLGLIQGVAEFLPISSSGHLAIAQNLLNINAEVPAFYDVLLHLGTLVAVFVAYWQDICDMVREFFCGIGDLVHHSTPTPVPPARRLILLIILGTLPLFAILPIKDTVEGLKNSMVFIGAALIVTGFLLFFSDRARKGRKDARSATVLDVLVVGVSQAIATVPGISRSGMTITTGCFVGFERRFAVRFSFLLSIPAVLGANILSLKDALTGGVDWSQLPVYLAGVAVAAVSGYLCIRLLKMIADKGRFGAFAYYCWAAGLATLILNAVK